VDALPHRRATDTVTCCHNPPATARDTDLLQKKMLDRIYKMNKITEISSSLSDLVNPVDPVALP